MPCKGKQNIVGLKGSRDCIEKVVDGCSSPKPPHVQDGIILTGGYNTRLGLDKGGDIGA